MFILQYNIHSWKVSQLIIHVNVYLNNFTFSFGWRTVCNFHHFQIVFLQFFFFFFRKAGDDNKMLVCDTCDKGYHTYCLKPVMTTIPKNGWKCKVSFLLNIIWKPFNTWLTCLYVHSINHVTCVLLVIVKLLAMVKI